MTSIPIVLLIVFVAGIAAVPRKFESLDVRENHVSSKRALWDFGIMIHCGTGRSPFDFNGYGCHCGFGGKGRFMDDVDRCCYEHDRCYDYVIKKRLCPIASVGPYFMPYSTKGCTKCRPSSYYWFYGKCRNALCECDSRAVQCFKRSKYNDKYKHYPQSKC